jgi:hypothetical protein
MVEDRKSAINQLIKFGAPIGQTWQLAGFPDPAKEGGSDKLRLPLRWQKESYTRSDPTPKPQLAVPVSTIAFLQQERLTILGYTAVAAVTDLCMIAFYFFLRVDNTQPPAQENAVEQFNNELHLD